MTNQTPSGDAGKGVKNSSNTVQKPISTKTLVGAVLVLLAAVGIGMVIREFRFRSSGEKHMAQAPKAVQPRDIPGTRQAQKEPEIQDIQEELPIEEVFVEPESLTSEPVSPPPSSMVDADGQSNTEAQAETSDQDPRAKERRARIALGMIGYDPDADEVWIQLINDPSLSENARSNLIEDLNEDGFADPDNPTLDELPMIEYRLELIEDLLPYAMDKVNEDAFKEARKDLVNMVDRLKQR
ncbi:hypothetical protein ACFL3Q_06815 [Planctomycetota bacterium]